MTITVEPQQPGEPDPTDLRADLARIRQRARQMSGQLAELCRQVDELARAIEQHQAVRTNVPDG
jgi:hypothetical protein